jgi:hypothetical protein
MIYGKTAPVDVMKSQASPSLDLSVHTIYEQELTKNQYLPV